jgi:transposase, IS5 family
MLYSSSDNAAEFQIRDRFSFMRFLRLELADAVPDAMNTSRTLLGF